MTPADLRALIGDHAATDPKEVRDRELILGHLQTPGNPFDRGRFLPGHLTGSAFVLDEGGRGLLMVHHARLGKWLQPGGHGEAGETDPFAVALREVLEETGLSSLRPHPGARQPFDLDVHAIPARPGGEPAHLHLDIRYALLAAPGQVPRASAESQAVAWVPLEEAAARTPDLVRAVAKLRALRISAC